jgi:hypothetical protein
MLFSWWPGSHRVPLSRKRWGDLSRKGSGSWEMNGIAVDPSGSVTWTCCSKVSLVPAPSSTLRTFSCPGTWETTKYRQ